MRHATYVPDFTRLRVAVVGDLIADHYVQTYPTRLSREAPVIVLRHRGEHLRAGGAANVARNLWALGANTHVVGAVGADANGREVLRLLEEEQVDVAGVAPVRGWITPTKTRICASEPARSPHQVLRVDREPDGPLPAEHCTELAARVRALAGEIDALLVSDYGYGVAGQELAEAALAVRASGATVLLDPRGGLERFRGVTAMTPNLTELAAETGRRFEDLEDTDAVAECAGILIERCAPSFLLVTRGNRGMTLFGSDLPESGVSVAASGPIDGVDPTGAGDTAAAVFLLGLAAGMSGPEAMRISNAASGVVVMENGTVPCSLSRLRSALVDAPVPEGLTGTPSR